MQLNYTKEKQKTALGPEAQTISYETAQRMLADHPESIFKHEERGGKEGRLCPS